MKNLIINIKQEITLGHFEEIIVSSLEGGSNYWYFINWEDIPKGNDPASMKIAKKLFEDPEFKLPVYDTEKPDELLGTVTQQSMLEALELAHVQCSSHYYALIDGTGDADTADAIFQLATMKEIVFG